MWHCAARKVTSRTAAGLGFTAGLIDVVLHECNHLLKFVLELGALCRGVCVQGSHNLWETQAGMVLRQLGCPPASPAPPTRAMEPKPQPELQRREPTLPHSPRAHTPGTPVLPGLLVRARSGIVYGKKCTVIELRAQHQPTGCRGTGASQGHCPDGAQGASYFGDGPYLHVLLS